MIFLRQSTASQEVPLGRFVSSTDGDTERTALTIANTDIKVWKTGATTLASKNSGGATHIANGEYYCVMDATDSDTIGPMKVSVHVATALSVQVWCTVLDEAVYDALFGTTALSTYAGGDTSGTTTLLTRVTAAVALNSDMSTVLSRLTSTRAGYLDNLSAGAVAQAFALSTVSTRVLLALPAIAPGAKGGLPKVIDSGSAAAIDSNTITLAGGTLCDPSGASVIVESAAGWENKNVSAIDATGLIATVATSFTLAHTLPATYTFYSLGAVAATNYATTDDAATTQSAIATLQGDVTNLKDRTPDALTSDGNMKVDVLAVDGTDQTGGDLAALAAAIKAKTDPMTYTLPNKLDVNTKAVADDPIEGSGTSNDKWRPA